jgi:hypothetical protein
MGHIDGLAATRCIPGIRVLSNTVPKRLINALDILKDRFKQAFGYPPLFTVSGNGQMWKVEMVAFKGGQRPFANLTELEKGLGTSIGELDKFKKIVDLLTATETRKGLTLEIKLKPEALLMPTTGPLPIEATLRFIDVMDMDEDDNVVPSLPVREAPRLFSRVIGKASEMPPKNLFKLLEGLEISFSEVYLSLPNFTVSQAGAKWQVEMKVTKFGRKIFPDLANFEKRLGASLGELACFKENVASYQVSDTKSGLLFEIEMKTKEAKG